MMPINDCPFCGSGNVDLAAPGKHWVRCDDCWATGPEADEPDKAIYLWNVPVDDHDRLLNDSKRLRRELDDCQGIIR